MSDWPKRSLNIVAPKDDPAAPLKVCSMCQGRKVIGTPGLPCDWCKGTGVDKIATEFNALTPEVEQRVRQFAKLIYANVNPSHLGQEWEEIFTEACRLAEEGK